MLTGGTDETCVFCAIVARTAPAHIVGESELALAFLDPFPAAAGHVLVVPKGHAIGLLDIATDSLAAVLELARTIAGRQVEKLHADGVSLFQSTGAAAGQDVFHFHVHLVPRRTDDHLVQPWSGRLATHAEQIAVARLLNAVRRPPRPSGRRP